MRIILKRDYDQDIRLAKHRGHVFWYGLLLLVMLAAPLALGNYYLGELARIMIYALAALGLMVVVGFTGQVSLGHAAFLALGAYANALALAHGASSLVAIPLAGAVSLLFGLVVALIAARMSGIYLAIATIAFAFIVERAITGWTSLTGGNLGMAVEPPLLFGHKLWSTWEFYYLCLALLIAGVLAVQNYLRAPAGRAMIAVRDSEVSARSLGVKVTRTKVFAFAVSAALTGVAGALLAHYMQFLSPETFGVLLSIQLLLMVVVGGLGTVHGALLGALLIGLLETDLSLGKDLLPAAIGRQPGFEPLVFGTILVAFIIYEPQGVYGRWLKIRAFFEQFPAYRRKTFVRQRAYLKTERMR